LQALWSQQPFYELVEREEMSEQLWTDQYLEFFFGQPHKNAVQVAKNMRNEYEAKVAERNAEIERLRAAIRIAVEQINLVPATDNNDRKMRRVCRDIVAAIIKEHYP
jgi:hypothetical protein